MAKAITGGYAAGLLDATAEGCTSGVLLLDRTGTRVQNAVGPGLTSSYSESLEGCAASGGA